MEVPFGLPWWRTKLSNTQPCRWCPFPPSTLTSANSKQLLFSNPFLLLNEGQQAASPPSRQSLVLPKPLKKKYFLRGCPSASLHPRLSTPVSLPHSCVFSQEGKREQRSKKGRRFKASNGVPGVSIGLPATKSEFLLWKLLLGVFVQLSYRNLLPSLCKSWPSKTHITTEPRTTDAGIPRCYRAVILRRERYSTITGKAQ